jgi:hypothetical protein
MTLSKNKIYNTFLDARVRAMIFQKQFKVEINWNDNKGDCDIIFKNGVVFGHLCSYSDLIYVVIE